MDATRWNRIRYTLWAPVYDVVKPLFSRYRKKSIRMLDIQPDHSVLLIGCGTGLDLEHLPPAKEVIATDITPAMVKRTAQRMRQLGIAGRAEVMDAQTLQLPNASFDRIVMHLIVAVVPDPVKTLREAERVLKPDGAIVIFDKFVAPGQRAGSLRRLLNLITRPLFTSIDRRTEDILPATLLEVEHDEMAGLGLGFRIMRLRHRRAFREGM
jgi:phosphatidylethanolamine/phosphatidyl-N-methylethanolamine N-methyltransferase